jgi:hypothetical protein
LDDSRKTAGKTVDSFKPDSRGSMNKIGFFIGHKNYLPHAMLLCKSLSDNFFKGKEFETYAMTPEHQNIRLPAPDVTQVSFAVPPAFRHIPFADKVFAAAAFEAKCESGCLWLDADSYFFKAAEFPETPELLMNPVDKKNIGDACRGERSILWLILYDYFSLAPIDAFVVTRAAQERIYPYYNMGMVAVNDKRNLFNTTKDALSGLLKREDIKKILEASALHSIFFHQAVLTCAALKLYGFENIGDLPCGVNYPLHLHAKHKMPIQPDDLVSIRYDTFFEENEVPAQWKHIFSNTKNQLRNTWYY